MLSFKKIFSCFLTFTLLFSYTFAEIVTAEDASEEKFAINFDNLPLGDFSAASDFKVSCNNGGKTQIVKSQDGNAMKITVSKSKNGSVNFNIPINLKSSNLVKISYDLKIDSNTVWLRNFPKMLTENETEIANISNGWGRINLNGDPGTYVESVSNLKNGFNKITVIIDKSESKAYVYTNNEYKITDSLKNAGDLKSLYFNVQTNDTYNGNGTTNDGVYYIDNITVENCETVKMIGSSISDKQTNVENTDVMAVAFSSPLNEDDFCKENFMLYENGIATDDYFVKYTPDRTQAVIARENGWNYGLEYSLKIKSGLQSEKGQTDCEYMLSFETKPLAEISDFKLYRTDGKIKAVASVKGNTDKTDIITAMYDKNGTLLSVLTSPADIKNKKTVISYFDDKDEFSVKCFLWNQGSIVPVCEANEKNVEDIYSPTELFVEKGASGEKNGTIDNPFATIEEARDYINENNEIKNAVVNIREGEYDYISESLIFDSNCTKNVTYRGYKNEKVVINGAYRLDSSKIEIYKGDIKKIDLSDDPIELGEVSYKGTDGTRIRDMWSELIVNGEIMTLSRYPNESDGVLSLGGMDTDANGTDGTTPLAWSYSYKLGKDNTVYNKIAELKVCKDLFVYDWFAPKYIGVLEGVTVEKKTLSATCKVSLKEFHSEENGSKGGTVVNDGQPRAYYFVNALELVDVPNEYYIDRENKVLYFIPPETDESLDIRLTANQNTLLKIEGAKNITFKNLTFTGGKGSGISIGEKSTNINFDNVTVRNFGCNGISYGACESAYNSRIERSEVFDTGEKGITMLAGDNKKLLSCGISIYDNKIHKIGRVYAYHSAAIYEHTSYEYKNGTPGLYIGYNEIYDVNDWAICASIDTTVEYNDIHHCAKYGDDTGALYWGQCYYNRGRKLLHNYIHDIKTYNKGATHGVHGLYLDGATGVTVVGNIFENIDNYGIFSSDCGMHDIHDNIIIGNSESNEKYESGTGIGITTGGIYNETAESIKTKIPEYSYTSPLWIGRYPYLADNLKLEKPNVPSSKIYRNYIFNSNKVSITDKFYDHSFALYENNEELIQENVTFENLKNKTVTLDKIDGFLETDYSKIGDVKTKVLECAVGSCVIYSSDSDLCLKNGKIQTLTDIPIGEKLVFGDITVVNSNKPSDFYDEDILECIRRLVDIY